MAARVVVPFINPKANNTAIMNITGLVGYTDKGLNLISHPGQMIQPNWILWISQCTLHSHICPLPGFALTGISIPHGLMRWLSPHCLGLFQMLSFLSIPPSPYTLSHPAVGGSDFPHPLVILLQNLFPSCLVAIFVWVGTGLYLITKYTVKLKKPQKGPFDCSF